MTWSKFPDDFSEDCERAGLSDAAFRTHTEGVIWAMRRENGGHVDGVALKRGFSSPLLDAAILDLLAAGFWIKVEGGYQIVHTMDHQAEPELLAQRRQIDSERQRRRRLRQAREAVERLSAEEEPPDVTA